MLKTMIASKTARLIATCVCPVAGTAGITLGVPQVRSAVHKATAPRAYALPKTRATAPDAAAIQTASVPCLDIPTALSQGLIAPIGPSAFTPVGRTPGGGVGGPPGGGGGGFVPPPTPPTPVPEPSTWVQLLLGFGLIGGIARMTMRPVDMRKQDEGEAQV